MSAERRQFIRCPIPESDDRAVLLAADRQIDGRLTDTSTGGFCVEVSGETGLKAGDKCILEIHSGSCEVRVVHLQDAGAAVWRVGLERLSDVVVQPECDLATRRTFEIGLPKARWELLAIGPVAAILIAASVGWDMFGEATPNESQDRRQIWEKDSAPPAANHSRLAVHAGSRPETARQAAAHQPIAAGSQRAAVPPAADSNRTTSFNFDVRTAFANFEAIEAPEVGVALGLSKSQQRQIRALLDGTARRLLELQGTVADTSAESSEVIGQASQKLLELLDARQQAIWSNLQQDKALPDQKSDGLVGSAR